MEAQQGKRKPIEFHIQVDGEPVVATREYMTPNEIISELAGKDPSANYLVQIHGNQQDSYKDTPNTPIQLKNGMRFQVISTGPTPVSDSGGDFGAAAFVKGLQQLGLTVKVAPSQPDHIAMDYIVPAGKFKGEKVQLGFVVPADFPVTTPTGPHVSPRIHAQANGGMHPHGGIHTDRSQNFEVAFGGEWQYWSRPIQGWGESHKTVDTYMAFVWRLWETQ